MTFNGRIHANENIYALRNTKFLKRITMGGEWIRWATRGGEPNTASGSNNVYVESNGINVYSSLGSMVSGGGTVGEETHSLSDLPVLRIGSRYLLILNREDNPVFSSVRYGAAGALDNLCPIGVSLVDAIDQGKVAAMR